MRAEANWTERLTRRRPIDTAAGDHHGHGGLGRTMSLFQLMMLGVGATIGTGIFFALSETVPEAGPGVIVSFLIAGLVAGLTALCYAEIASTVPVSGSSYSYAYVTMGEGIAFMVAGCLILEYGIATSAVAIGWSGYLNEVVSILTSGALEIPAALRQAPFDSNPDGESVYELIGTGTFMNLPAFLLVWVCAFMLMRGTKESAAINAVMVVIKLGVLVMFILISASAFERANLTPFMPFGFAGVSAAAGTIFFSFVGLDAVATASEEVVNPRRNIPLAIIGALLIVSTVYVGVAVTGLGAQPVAEFAGQEAGLAEILRKVTGTNIWALVLAAGAVISVFSVTLVSLYGQTRIIFAISRDGMLPKAFHRVNEHTQSPNFNTVFVASVVSLIAAFVPSSILWDLVSIGTLVAFTVVSAAVIILRRTQPDLPRGYSVPLYPFLPIASIVACLYVMSSLNGLVWTLFLGWLVVGGIYYFLYAGKHSVLERAGAVEAVRAGGAAEK